MESSFGRQPNREQENLENFNEWKKEHEKRDEKRFKEISQKVENLITKDDFARMFYDENGQPKFATRKDMAPLLALYQGSIFAKSFLLGIAAVVGAIVGIGWGLIAIRGWLN